MVVEFIYWLLGAQVELVKASGQNYSSSHILDVYRGSLSQSVCLSNFIYLCMVRVSVHACVGVRGGGVSIHLCACVGKCTRSILVIDSHH